MLLITRKYASLILVLCLSSASIFAGPRATRNLTALDRYVFKPDPSYRYELVSSQKGQGYSSYVLQMTSQTWRTESEVNLPVWKHWLVIALPEKVRTPIGLLFVSGGSNRSGAPKSINPLFAGLAVSTQSVIAELRQIPSEPLKFADEGGRERSEDEIIAYSWDKFLRTGDETWPLRLPMTKSVVKAMDTITAFCGAPERGGVKVEKYVVGGASKRGWTTWTTAAVDDRVVAIMPLVIDVLNMGKSMENHYRAYGFWAPSIHDYVEMGIMNRLNSPRYRELMKIEDPYSYRDRLTMPKYIINSTGDQYFTPDSWKFYFNDLKGEKYLRYVPNTKHDLEKSDAPLSLQSFYETVLNGSVRPRFSWKFERDGSIVVDTPDKPTEVKLWQATNPKARDFRLDTLGAEYKGSVIQPARPGKYVARVLKPEQGWTAYFVEMTFQGSGKIPLKFTTGVRIIPDVLPSLLPK